MLDTQRQFVDRLLPPFTLLCFCTTKVQSFNCASSSSFHWRFCLAFYAFEDPFCGGSRTRFIRFSDQTSFILVYSSFFPSHPRKRENWTLKNLSNLIKPNQYNNAGRQKSVMKILNYSHNSLSYLNHCWHCRSHFVLSSCSKIIQLFSRALDYFHDLPNKIQLLIGCSRKNQ